MKNCISLLLLFCCLLTGCDPAYQPVVVNGYDQSVKITLSFASGMPAETGIRLLPKTEFVQRRKGLQLEEITVTESSGTVRVYTSTELEAARSARRVNFEVWILSENGLKLGDKDDLQKLRSERK